VIEKRRPSEGKIMSLAVIVSALGYFVDIFDLLLFSIVRVESLESIGVGESQLLPVGMSLLNYQMLGVLFGGLFWGMLGDRKGRVSVLFGSIFLYSIANLANAYVNTVETYAIWRFIAGLGLAGELGVAVTLVSEILSAHNRGFATTVIASFGVLGSVAAALAANYLSWRGCYTLGGILGLSLLALRLRIHEPALFRALQSQNISRGNFFMLFKNNRRLLRYLCLILIGAPIWFVIGIVVTFSHEVSKALQVQGEISSGAAVLYCYGGLAFGDLISGFWSQISKSRKKIMGIFLVITFVVLALMLISPGLSRNHYYGICFLLGIGSGYWAVLVTTAAEMFGTNLRSTVATTVPNFIRGSVVPLGIVFHWLNHLTLGIIPSLAILGAATIIVALFSVRYIPETYGIDLGFVERDPD
jgi:MFS family permease